MPTDNLSHPDWLDILRHHRAIAVVRASNLEIGLAMAKAVVQGGCHLLEVIWQYQPVPLIKALRTEFPNCWVGAGTILSITDLEEAIAAGIQFGFSPHTDPALIRRARDYNLPYHPGALSPTEILRACSSGATGVKIFPVEAMGGSSYIRQLQGPLGHIPLIPTGGVTLENAKDFIAAGAIAVGLSGNLFPKEAIVQGDWAQITQHMNYLMQSLQGQDLT
jgi:2-dehydro-3-deoxyphosphogluconate aldolase / (4S)-4-hydroxy-2-oxoglutarate aldolase